MFARLVPLLLTIATLATIQAQPSIGSSGACTTATLSGPYGYAISGKLVSTFGDLAAFADSGTFVADGKGRLSGSGSDTAGAQINRRNFLGTYTVSPDCTGSAILTDTLGNSVTVAMTVADDGRVVDFIETDAGAIISGSAKLRPNHCTAPMLSGGYGYAIEGWFVGVDGYQHPFGAAGSLFSDGKGGLSGTTTASSAGLIDKRAMSGTYNVSDDCTGSAALRDDLGQTSEFDIVVVDYGREVLFIQTDPGTIISGGVKLRAGACGTRNVNGPYSYAIDGWVVALIGGGLSPFADSGRIEADGAGRFSGASVVSNGGVVAKRAITGTYAVDDDCLGSATFNDGFGNALAVDLVVVNDGRELQFIQTDPGTVVSGGARRQDTSTCTNALVQGAYAYAISGWVTSSGLHAFADNGKLVANGQGTFSGVSNSSLDGDISQRTLTGTYRVNADCTGSAIFRDTLGNVLGLDFSLAGAGRQIQFIETDAGTAISGIAMRQFSTGGDAILNAASFWANGITPGSLFTIFGEHLAGAETGATKIPLPTILGDTSVLVNGVAIPLIYANPWQINAQMPLETAPGQAQLIVKVGNSSSAPATFVVAQIPGIFTYGVTRAVVVNPDGAVNAQSSPAHAGDVLVAYLTGGGPVDACGPLVTGAANPMCISPVKLAYEISVGGHTAHADYLGLAPGWVGLYQANFTVPTLPPGDYPLVVTVAGQSSNGPMVSVH